MTMSSPQAIKPVLFKNQKPHVALFDWDDTLIATWPYLWGLYQKYLKLYGRPMVDQKELKVRAVREGHSIFPSLFGQSKCKEVQDAFLGEYHRDFIRQLSPLQGAEEMLASLKSQEIQLGIVSNKESKTLNREIQHLGWEKYFSVIIGRGDAIRAKPFPEPVLVALEKIQNSPGDHVWFFGDTIIDHQAARASGCFSVVYGSDHSEADLSVTNWNQLGEILS